MITNMCDPECAKSLGQSNTVPKDDSITMEVDYAINAAFMINCLDKRSDRNANRVAVAKD